MNNDVLGLESRIDNSPTNNLNEPKATLSNILTDISPKYMAICIALLLNFFPLASSAQTPSQASPPINCGLMDFSEKWSMLGYDSKNQCFADLVLKHWTEMSVDKGTDSLLICIDSLFNALQEKDIKNLRIIDDIFSHKTDIFAEKYELAANLKDYRRMVFLYLEDHPTADKDEELLSENNKRLKSVTELQRKLLHAYKAGILDITALEELYPLINRDMTLDDIANVLKQFEEKRK